MNHPTGYLVQTVEVGRAIFYLCRDYLLNNNQQDNEYNDRQKTPL